MTSLELEEFYTLIGKAVWHVQYLEDVLATFLAVKVIDQRRSAGKKLPADDAVQLLADKRKITLGPLLAACQTHKIIRPEQQARFDAFKEERHWLVHRSLIKSGNDLHAADARAVMFARLTFVADEAISLKAAVFDDYQDWLGQRGVDLAAASAVADAEIRKLVGRPELE